MFLERKNDEIFGGGVCKQPELPKHFSKPPNPRASRVPGKFTERSCSPILWIRKWSQRNEVTCPVSPA